MGKIKDSFAQSYDRFVKRPTLLPIGLSELVGSTNAKEIAEFASGTGTVSIGLSLEGYKVTGVDYSPDMIRQAQNKAEEFKSKTHFVEADIAKIDLGRKFDLLLCLGNTVPHFVSTKPLGALLANARKHLNDGGVLILQQLNYNRILTEKPATFEINVDRNIVRIKQYRYRKTLIDFWVTIADGSHIPPQINNSKITLKPWLRNDLVTAVDNAGFKRIRVYGNYSKERFSIKSKDLILVAVASEQVRRKDERYQR
jgi:glycine/sarcosine N-methyltransferase